MFHFYQPGEEPPVMAYIGAGDYAVTEKGNDFTELAVWGVDSRGELWEVDWWHEQCDTGKSANMTLDMATKWKTVMWLNEGGTLDRAMRPLLNVLMRQRAAAGNPAYTDIRAITNMHDKVAKVASFQGRAAAGGERTDGSGLWNHGVVHFRDTANSRRVVQQLIDLPAGRYDDACDVCGLIGRAVDQFPNIFHLVKEKKEGLVPFTPAWLEHEEKPDVKIRHR